ncbi:MAG: GNAT family N-acetyltransferase [Anaerolineaceae bacterium]|nr:GNAT family N-acetyltransferase [Anaerolineaceae bacterium]
MFSEYIIRPAKPEDLAAVRDICLKTSKAGLDGTALYLHPEALWAVYADPYLVYSPQTCFVAEDGEGVCGYTFSALDAEAMLDWALEQWLPPFQEKFPLLSAEERTEADEAMIRLIHQPWPILDFVRDYPSELHIDILPRAQKRGIGKKLIQRLLEKLAGLGSKGVFFGVDGSNQNAQGFYRHMGFEDLMIFPNSACLMGMKLQPKN